MISNVKLKPRSSFWLTRLLDKFGGSVYWTTVGDTIYYPDVYDLETAQLFTEIIEHEQVHLEQYKKYGTVPFLFLYALVFLPVGLSYFRWKFEREAYLVGIVKHGDSIEEAVKVLWSGYGYPWPKSLMRSWFEKQLAKAKK